MLSKSESVTFRMSIYSFHRAELGINSIINLELMLADNSHYS